MTNNCSEYLDMSCFCECLVDMCVRGNQYTLLIIFQKWVQYLKIQNSKENIGIREYKCMNIKK
jgi:hypothetical protein